ncbi:hypothetical protein DID88_007390 [Monilinia fructigena]|uniref:Histone-lysine N-methyltransferase, H3 lysine-36 specific n=1 Tax=Monilinia fructigena TaxID=38457 RepID=A0A395J870_9HELO|nr:hypothetical protein DID88_007390 [Monilinia fructigena]
MVDDTREVQPEAVNAALGEMKLEQGMEAQDFPTAQMDIFLLPQKLGGLTPIHQVLQTPTSGDEEDKETIGGDITVTVEPGKAPKLSRKSLQKVIPRPPPLFNDLPDSTEEAASVFQVIKDCIYGAKHMGASDHDALDCDCPEEYSDGKNHACGEDSDCINRLTKMECGGGHKDCNCGVDCQNQRFQRRQYAKVSVIKTDKKGYGLRANTDLHPDDFIFEYIGEVINEPTFRKRTIQYDQEGIKHFYFMSLTKHEFVDATKKGNLGRFCNHSCNPNCYVDKWVVGEKLRMGIFAERAIKAGEELVFNYNVDRYGADPQPCYCAEPNCTGFIGGKTQTERATKLSHATIEALGIDDGDGWDTAVAKKPRKKKTGEDDEEYVNNVQPKGLDESGVRKVMATLMQCKEKWIAVKLLGRIQRCEDDRVRNRVIQMHGYQILRTTLNTWKEDNNVVLQVFDILYKFPRLTRNKIVDSNIETVLKEFKSSEHEDVAFEANRLLEEWSKLEFAYRIPRRAPTLIAQVFERRPEQQPEKVTQSPSPVIVAPTGPGVLYLNATPTSTPIDLYLGASISTKTGQTTWERPFMPAGAVPPLPPPKAAPKISQKNHLQLQFFPLIPPRVHRKRRKSPLKKWRLLPLEKQMKLYENTLFPHIKHVMQRFSAKLPKDDLKKFAKEVGKKLVASDFKNNRVEDPTKISEKQERKVKKYVRDYFEKAVEKKKAMDRKRAERKRREGQAKSNENGTDGKESKPENTTTSSSPDAADDEDVEVDVPSPTASPSGQLELELLKRKRDNAEDEESLSENKRVKEDGAEGENLVDSSTPPPPPPPPPAGGMPISGSEGLEMGNCNSNSNGDGDGDGDGDVMVMVMEMEMVMVIVDVKKR